VSESDVGSQNGHYLMELASPALPARVPKAMEQYVEQRGATSGSMSRVMAPVETASPSRDQPPPLQALAVAVRLMFASPMRSFRPTVLVGSVKGTRSSEVGPA
jgi:hypothetical protein